MFTARALAKPFSPASLLGRSGGAAQTSAVARGEVSRPAIRTGRRRVVFAYRQAHASAGSKIMRCDQLAQIARTRLGERFAFETLALPPPRRSRRIRAAIESAEGAIVILLKRADLALDPSQAADLSRAACGVCVDYVDAPLGDGLAEIADMHIAASKAAFSKLRARASSADAVRLVTHHADPRIVWRKDFGEGRFRLCYFGDERHFTPPPALTDSIERAAFARRDDAATALGALRRASMHYAVRAYDPVEAARRLVAKPFTKGFNAAAANANILINRDAPEIEGYLDDDYPFLIESAHPVHIAEGVRRARDAFGGRDWRDGLERMAAIRAECAPERVAAQLSAVLNALG